MLHISWPNLHVAVACEHLQPEDRDDLTAAQLRVVKPDPKAIAAALRPAQRRAARGPAGRGCPCRSREVASVLHHRLHRRGPTL
jgi:hypothetical protein